MSSLILFCATFGNLRGQQTADVRLVCLSPKFHSATARYLGYNYTLSFEHYDGPDYDSAPNGELHPFLTDSLGDFQSVYGYYMFHSAAFPTRDPNDDFYIDLPAMGDLNNNGLSDFFEIPLGIPTTVTGGEFEETVQSNGTNIITWSRAANTNIGTCTMHMDSPYLKVDASFPVVFELLDYAGTFYYTPGNPTVQGWLSLTQTGRPTNKLFGPLSFDKSGTDLLAGQSVTLTNSDRHRFHLTWNIPGQTEISLVQRFGSSYSGYFSMDDGDPSTSYPDFLMWAILISDPNDSNQDGIPDFTDPVLPAISTNGVTPPRLAISQSAGKISIALTGTPGFQYQVETSSAVASAEWSPSFSSFVTTEDPQITVITAPSSSTFWRAHQLE